MRTLILPYALACSLVLSGCCTGTPLRCAVRDFAPGFYPRQPATSADQLGFQRHQNSFDNAACYASSRTIVASGPKNIALEYGQKRGGDVLLDFGRPLVTGTLKIDRVTKSSITISESEEISLDGIYFKPSSICGETRAGEYAGACGANDRIVAKSLRAKRLQAWQSAEGGMSASILLEDRGGKLVLSSSTAGSGWDGDNLFFAYQLKEVRTRRTRLRDFPNWPRGKPTDPVDGDVCQISVSGQPANSWEGKLLCPIDEGVGETPIGGPLGTMIGVHAAGSVSYQIAVDYDASTSLFRIRYYKWTVDESQRACTAQLGK